MVLCPILPLLHKQGLPLKLKVQYSNIINITLENEEINSKWNLFLQIDK